MMSFHGYDPGDRNNWYQSPQLGLFPVSPAVHCGGISGACYRTYASHPHGSPSYPPPPPQFPFQPSYSPPPSQTIINGYVFPHQFPCVSQTHAQFSPSPQLQSIYPTAQQPLTITPRSSSIPHSNPNPWISPPISQSQSYDLHSQSISTKSMTTTPIYHSTPPPPACEQPHTIADPKPQSPPRSSGELQDHKEHKDAKLCEMQKSLKRSMDTFISEFKEELRLLWGSSQSPASQVDNPLNSSSPPPPSTPKLILVATEASSPLIPAENGIIRKTPVVSGLNLPHSDVILGFNDNTSMSHVVGFVCDAILNGIDEKLDTGKGESSDKRAEVNSGDGRGFNEHESVIVKQDGQGRSLCGNSREYHALCMFDKVPLSDGLCNAGTTIVAPMNIRDKGGGLATHHEIVDVSLMSTELLSSSIPVLIETDGGEKNVVMADDRESSKMDSLEQGTEPSSDSLVGNAALWLIDCLSNVAAGQSISTAFKNFLPQRYASLVQAACSFLRERQKSTNEPFVSVGGTQHSLVGSAKQTKVLKHLSSLEAIVPVPTTPGSKHNDILIMGCTKLLDDFKVDDHRCDFHRIFIQPLIAFYLRYIGKQPSLGRYDDSHAKVASIVLNEEDMFVTVINICTALVFKNCPFGIVEVPEKWFLDAINMNLETMIGKCSSVEKELHVVFLENSMKLDQKCLGYVLSNLDAPYKSNLDAPYKFIERGSSLVQYISDPGFLENNTERSPCRYENVISASQSYISQYDIVVGFLLLNLSMWLQLFSQIIIHNETTSATFLCVLAINCDPLSEQADVYPKSPCELERAINWKKVQGYQVVLGIAALKLYLFYVFTVWSRIIVDVVVAILLSRISLIKQQYAWQQFLLGGSVAPMSTDDIDISNIREFLASIVLLNNVERDENLIAALASSLGKDCSGCIKNGELDQSCKKIYLCHDQFKAFVRSNLYICKWFGLSVICVQGLTLLLAIILKALGLYHYYDSDDDYTLERVSLLNCLPPCVFGNTTYGSKYDIWHVLMIIFGDYLWTMYDQPKDNILIGDIELLGVLAIFISALVLGGAHDQLFWYYKSRIMKYLKELAQVFDIKSQMETLVDYQLDTKQIYEESCINGSVTKTKEKQLKAMVIDTSLGSDLDDEAGRPVKVLTDIDQASHACLFAWRTFSIVAFLILGALLISVTHAMSIIAASFVQLSIEVDGYNNDKPLTCIAKITGMSHRIPQVQCHLLEVGRHFRLEVKHVL